MCEQQCTITFCRCDGSLDRLHDVVFGECLESVMCVGFCVRWKGYIVNEYHLSRYLIRRNVKMQYSHKELQNIIK